MKIKVVTANEELMFDSVYDFVISRNGNLIGTLRVREKREDNQLYDVFVSCPGNWLWVANDDFLISRVPVK